MEGSRTRLVTLGSAYLARIGADGTSTNILRPGKPLALLIYLAASPARTASREHLLNLLWADAEPERGLRTLRQTVFSLRQTLGEGAIESTGRDLTLALAPAFDRDEFLAAVSSGDPGKAIALYRGPFLADFGVPGGAEFEHWADRERDRLQSAYVRSAESFIRSKLDHAQYDRAIAEARRLRDFDPNLESSWRLLLEALASSGDQVSTLAEAEELERFLASEDREPESLTRSAIARARKARATAPPEETSATRLVAELTGRDREFSRLTSAWTRVKSGHFRHIHVSAPPGLGKTRLLRDVYTRLRASGARAVWIGAVAGERKLAYALASDIAGKVGQLAGASGVSTAAASSLIALNPKLSSSFSANPDRSDGEEALRRRVHAVNELLEAVADEAPLALFIDDMHWADSSTRQLLKSAFSRIGDCRILLITSARSVPGGDLHLTTTESVALEPLDRHEAWGLVSSFGVLADEEASHRFIDALHGHTGGSPFLMLENLHLAIERELLELSEGAWHIDDVDALVEGISRGDVLEQRLKKLEPRLFRILLTLAIAEEPVSAWVVASALGFERTGEGDLSMLDQQSLASTVGTRWRVAHDSIGEAVVRMVRGEERASIQGALGSALARTDSSDLAQLRIAIRHLEAGGRRDGVEATFSRAVALARASGDRRSNMQIAAAMLGETSPSDAAARLVGSLPLTQRIGLSSPVRIATMSAAVVAAIVIPFQFQDPEPAKLAMIAQPLSAATLFVPPPIVEIQDKTGRRITDATDSVTVSTVDPSPGITGTLRVAAVEGRAEFKDVYVTGEGPVRLRFSAKGVKDVIANTINLSAGSHNLRLISGRINGQQISPAQRSFTVSPGGEIEGDVMLEYSSYWGSANVILGATGVWGDRRTNILDLAPLFTPAERQPRRARIRFKAPDTPGIYHIVFAFDAEGSVEDVMSGTNWKLPEPIWNDGNDIADWSPAQLKQANTRGWVDSRFVQIDNATGNPRVDPHPVPATVIDVVVR